MIPNTVIKKYLTPKVKPAVTPEETPKRRNAILITNKKRRRNVDKIIAEQRSVLKDEPRRYYKKGRFLDLLDDAMKP